MPVPLTVNPIVGSTVIVKAFVAKELNVMAATSVLAETDTAVVLERLNVAVSPDPLGTVGGVQFVAVFQSPEPGLRSHAALPALAERFARSRITVVARRMPRVWANRNEEFVPRRHLPVSMVVFTISC